MGNNPTVAFIATVAALSSFTALNRLMQRHPAVACIAALELTVGSLLIYIGFNEYLTYL